MRSAHDCVERFEENSTAVFRAVNVDVHFIKKISACRYIAQTAIVKVRMGSPKTAQNEQVCAQQKSYRKQIIQNIFWAIMHVRDCSCAPIFRFFLFGVRWRHSKPPNSGPHFLVKFFTRLRKDSVANYA